jgi:hypothetical protein
VDDDAYPSVETPSADDAEQFLLQDKLPLLVFLAALVGLVILPTHSFLALSARDVADDVATSCHAALDGLGLGDVHDVIEEVSFAVLATEVSADDIIVVRKMCLALLTAKNLVGSQINVV